MLTRVDFLHDINKNLLIDPSEVYGEIISTINFNKDNKDNRNSSGLKDIKMLLILLGLISYYFFFP